ncbi:MAG: YfiR family protein [Chromatiaceae bacterium]|nr:YfiR family protein [Chromatiaceae bacterium]
MYAAPPDTSQESRLKTALIYKLTKFVTWPERSAGMAPMFVLCVMGGEEMHDALQVLENRQVNNRSIRLLFLDSAEQEMEQCQLVYFSRNGRARIATYLGRLRDSATLTVGDAEGFAGDGGMVEITQHGRRLGFDINLSSAKRSGLSLAAPLLDLANIVEAP